uniref:NSFL1 cofactor p47 n=1 Tax=Panagrolaimus superbus TaxID=310955 RepID=A0A914Z1U5_9BILA
MKIHTLNNEDDDHRPNLERSDDESSGDEGRQPRRPPPQEFYVGGSEHSGQQVLGPRGPANGSSDEEDSNQGMFNTRLNQTGAAGGSSRAIGPVVRVNIEMFDDGFTVDDSPLRPYADPANIAFMDSLKRRETPPEFIRKYAGRPIDVHCFKKPGNYVFKPFTGTGNRLGSVVPPTVDLTDADQQLISDTAASTTDQMQTRAQESITLREGEPTTRIQFRLPMGHRITGTFNPSMTIVDHMRTFVVSADPAFAFNLFSFFAGFPPKKIDDEGLTIGGAELNNSVVNVRLV